MFPVTEEGQSKKNMIKKLKIGVSRYTAQKTGSWPYYLLARSCHERIDNAMGESYFGSCRLIQ